MKNGLSVSCTLDCGRLCSARRTVNDSRKSFATSAAASDEHPGQCCWSWPEMLICRRRVIALHRRHRHALVCIVQTTSHNERQSRSLPKFLAPRVLLPDTLPRPILPHSPKAHYGIGRLPPLACIDRDLRKQEVSAYYSCERAGSDYVNNTCLQGWYSGLERTD